MKDKNSPPKKAPSKQSKAESKPAPKPTEPKRPDCGALYIFTNTDYESKDLYKIGHVKTNEALKKRLTSLTCGNPDGKFVHTWESVIDPYQVEKDIHLVQKRRQNHYEKEWFKLENINLTIEEMSARINGRKLARQASGNNYEAECDAFLCLAAQGLDKCLDKAVESVRNGESLNQEKFSVLKVPKREDEYKKFCLEFPQSNVELKKFLLHRCCSKEVIEVYQHQMLFQSRKTSANYVMDLLKFATFSIK